MTTNTFAQDMALHELAKMNVAIAKKGHNFIVNNRNVNVRGCDVDKPMAQTTGPGWCRLDPKKFDYFICVSFDKNFCNVCYFVFSSEEVNKFPNVVWKNTPNLKDVRLKQDIEELKMIVESSKGAWDKLLKV